MKEIILSGVRNIELRLNDFEQIHYAVRGEYVQLRESYTDLFFSNKYMYVHDVGELVSAKDDFEEEYAKLLSSGATIATIRADIGIVPLAIMMNELINTKPITTEVLQNHQSKIDECERNVAKLKEFYNYHHQMIVEQRKIYAYVTRPKTA